MHHLLLAESPPPVVDASWFILLLTRVLHTASAGALLGGLLYLRQCVAPLVGEADNAEEAVYRGRRSAWAAVVMGATTLLLLSGFFNLYNIIAGMEKLPAAYHMIFGIKFLLAMFVFFVAAGTAGKSPMAVKMQGNLRFWLNLSLAASVLIFALGAALRTFDKVPRADDDAAAARITSSPDEIHG